MDLIEYLDGKGYERNIFDFIYTVVSDIDGNRNKSVENLWKLTDDEGTEKKKALVETLIYFEFIKIGDVVVYKPEWLEKLTGLVDIVEEIKG